MWRSGTKCDCKNDWLWVRTPLEEMKYLPKFIFPFLRSGVEFKRGVEFCHSTLNAFRIRQKVGNGVSLRYSVPHWFPTGLPTLLLCGGLQRETDFFYKLVSSFSIHMYFIYNIVLFWSDLIQCIVKIQWRVHDQCK